MFKLALRHYGGIMALQHNYSITAQLQDYMVNDYEYSSYVSMSTCISHPVLTYSLHVTYCGNTIFGRSHDHVMLRITI